MSFQVILLSDIPDVKDFNSSRSTVVIFEDLMNHCKLYASAAGVLASSVKEFPLLLSMLFAHHKKLIELESQMKEQSK